MRVENIRSYKAKPNEKVQYIGRPWEFGNPYIIGRNGTREEVIKKFEETLDESLIIKLDELNPDVLLCFCFPRPCHGDVYVRRVEQRRKERGK